MYNQYQEMMKPFTQAYEEHVAPVVEAQTAVFNKFVEVASQSTKAWRDAFEFALEKNKIK